VAQIYGAILRDLGLLSKGDVVVKVGGARIRRFCSLRLIAEPAACMSPAAPRLLDAPCSPGGVINALARCCFLLWLQVPADFVGSVLGESEKKTAAILEATVGCVLVIDEAYGLHTGKGGDIYKVRGPAGVEGCFGVQHGDRVSGPAC
jgi:hypothetical protein